MMRLGSPRRTVRAAAQASDWSTLDKESDSYVAAGYAWDLWSSVFAPGLEQLGVSCAQWNSWDLDHQKRVLRYILSGGKVDIESPLMPGDLGVIQDHTVEGFGYLCHLVQIGRSPPGTPDSLSQGISGYSGPDAGQSMTIPQQGIYKDTIYGTGKDYQYVPGVMTPTSSPYYGPPSYGPLAVEAPDSKCWSDEYNVLANDPARPYQQTADWNAAHPSCMLPLPSDSKAPPGAWAAGQAITVGARAAGQAITTGSPAGDWIVGALALAAAGYGGFMLARHLKKGRK